MSWQPGLILICTHLAIFGLGCWCGEGSKRRYKKKLFHTLYSGTGFKQPRREWKLPR